MWVYIGVVVDRLRGVYEMGVGEVWCLSWILVYIPLFL